MRSWFVIVIDHINVFIYSPLNTKTTTHTASSPSKHDRSPIVLSMLYPLSYDAGPTLIWQWMNVSCLLENHYFLETSSIYITKIYLHVVWRKYSHYMHLSLADNAHTPECVKTLLVCTCITNSIEGWISNSLLGFEVLMKTMYTHFRPSNIKIVFKLKVYSTVIHVASMYNF